MPAIDWADSAKMGYLSRAWPAPTSCVYSFLSNYLILKTLYHNFSNPVTWNSCASSGSGKNHSQTGVYFV